MGEMLVSAGIIDEFQLNSALSLQRNLGGRLGQSLIRLGYISEDRLLSFLSEQLNCPRVELDVDKIAADLKELIPEEKARQFNVLPLRRGAMSGTAYLLVAMADPTNLMVIDT
ncbi:MAG: MSHA biogenesis protein MshE, partial [Deltaproteobacteria bacterium]